MEKKKNQLKSNQNLIFLFILLFFLSLNCYNKYVFDINSLVEGGIDSTMNLMKAVYQYDTCFIYDITNNEIIIKCK